MRVSDISKKLGGKNRSKRLSSTEVIRYLDMATWAEQDGDPLLPLRMHLFHRTQMGLWVCANVSCEGRHKTALDHADWPFGKVFLSRKSHCDVSSCHAPVFELVLCSACGAEYLAATETRSDTGSILSARSYALDQDEFQQEFERLDNLAMNESTQQHSGFARMLTRASCAEAIPIGVEHPER